MPNPFNHATKPANHYYNGHRNPSSVTLYPDDNPNAWTPPTYYEYGYVATLHGGVGGAPLRIMERHYDPDTHQMISEKPNQAEADSYQIERPPGTYISVRSAETFAFQGDKDFG